MTKIDEAIERVWAHFRNLADGESFTIVLAEIDRLEQQCAAEYQRGLEEGNSNQAILELQGRDRFVRELKIEYQSEIGRLRSEVRKASVTSQTYMRERDDARAEIDRLRMELSKTHCDLMRELIGVLRTSLRENEASEKGGE